MGLQMVAKVDRAHCSVLDPAWSPGRERSAIGEAETEIRVAQTDKDSRARDSMTRLSTEIRVVDEVERSRGQ